MDTAALRRRYRSQCGGNAVLWRSDAAGPLLIFEPIYITWLENQLIEASKPNSLTIEVPQPALPHYDNELEDPARYKIIESWDRLRIW